VCTAKGGREDIFELAVQDESFHEIGNDAVIRVVNFCKLRCVKKTKNAMFISTIRLLLEINSQIDHVIIDNTKFWEELICLLSQWQ
jgi:hypothetical protein